MSVPLPTRFDSPNRPAIAFGIEFGPYVATGLLPLGRGLAAWNGSGWVRGSDAAPSGYNSLADLAVAYDYPDTIFGYRTSSGPTALPFDVRDIDDNDPIFSAFPPEELVSSQLNVVDLAVAADSDMLFMAVAVGSPTPALLVFQSDRSAGGQWVPFGNGPQPVLPPSTVSVRSVDVTNGGSTVYVAATYTLEGDAHTASFFNTDGGPTSWVETLVATGIFEPYTDVSLALGDSGELALAYCAGGGSTLSSNKVRVFSVVVGRDNVAATPLDDVSSSAVVGCRPAMQGRAAWAPPVGLCCLRATRAQHDRVAMFCRPLGWPCRVRGVRPEGGLDKQLSERRQQAPAGVRAREPRENPK